MKALLLSIPAILLMAACSQTEKTEAVTAEITAAQMEGRNAARDIIIYNWKDTTGIHKAMEHARAPRHKYDSLGHKAASAMFDTTFNKTIRTVHPDLAKRLGI
ncbi:MAG: hypothetical protein K2G29_03915 [Muribaculaceae bacterium]|nr:hypothetical protein [Muribaculaceae bacterium]